MRIPKIPERVMLHFLFLGRILIGALFFYSGLSKLIQPVEYFEIAISLYRIVPDEWIHTVALVMPWLEIVFGTFLFLGYELKKTAFILMSLTVIFQIVLGQAVARHLPMDECGCFGGGFIHLTLYQSLVMDTVMLLLLNELTFSNRHIYALDNNLS